MKREHCNHPSSAARRKALLLPLILLGTVLLLCSCHPIDVEQELKAGMKSAQEGNWQLALEKAELCLDNVPSSPDAAILKSLAIYSLSPNDAAARESAQDMIRRVTQENPDRYDAWLVYGWILLKCNRPHEAIPLLRKAYDLHIQPEKAAQVTQVVQGSIQYILGEACLRNALFKDAEKLLNQSLKRTPYNSWSAIYSDLGYIAYRQGKYKEAVKWMEKARKLSPNDYAITLNMAVLVDYLSRPNYNRQNYQAYAKQKQNWYKVALIQVQKERMRQTNAKNQVYLDRLAASIRTQARL